MAAWIWRTKIPETMAKFFTPTLPAWLRRSSFIFPMPDGFGASFGRQFITWRKASGFMLFFHFSYPGFLARIRFLYRLLSSPLSTPALIAQLLKNIISVRAGPKSKSNMVIRSPLSRVTSTQGSEAIQFLIYFLTRLSEPIRSTPTASKQFANFCNIFANQRNTTH